MNKRKCKKQYDDLLQKIDSIKAECRGYDHRTIWCVNVKRYHDSVELDDLLKDKQYKRYAKAIKEYFTDEHINDLWYSWIEYEESYILDDFIKGKCAYNHDEPEYKRLEYINQYFGNKNTFGFYGRSGGWFGFDCTDLLNRLDEIANEYDNKSYDNFFWDYAEILKIIVDVEWLLDFVDKYNKGMSFRDELIFRIDEYLNDDLLPELKKDSELNKAIKLASKYGYIVAKELKGGDK